MRALFKNWHLYYFFYSLVLFPIIIHSQDDLLQIRPFGTNPGNLKLMFYDPGNITQKAPLVVVLHGCTQTAKFCAQQTGWNKLAKQHKFYVLYPEQIIVNNPENCFNWYSSVNQTKDKGEPLSIMQMIDYLKKHKNIDSTKIYIVGLSAGGAMSSIMMAVYPEVFNKGGVMAGSPYKSTESIIKAGAVMVGMVSKSPEEWGTLVRDQNRNYKGTFPPLVVFHGAADPIVSINNSNQLIKQWVNIHDADYEVDEHFSHFKNNESVELSVYKNKQQQEIVRYYKIKGMGHAVALDTGMCTTQGGKTGIFAVDKNFHSTYWTAYFFGLIKPPYSILGETIVSALQQNLKYSVPYKKNSKYYWNTPSGMWIKNEKNSNIITVDADYKSGYIEVTEQDEKGCFLEASKLWIQVKE